MVSYKIIDGNGKVIPPIYDHVVIYFLQAGSTPEQALAFYNYYQSAFWRNENGSIIKNWKICAWKWIWHGNVELRGYNKIAQ